jgi:cytochrome c biogenesis protein CcmG/thiol:disulfide interchange protein DsbE
MVPDGDYRVWHSSAVHRALLPLLLLVVAAAPGCGAGDAKSRPYDPAQLKGAPPPIASLHKQASQLLDGGADAFKQRLASLKGYPVVVNKWASWCAPCRSEFPFFQTHATRLAKTVAFIGVNSNDNDGNARDFLTEFPVPYPSYKDPKLEVASVFKGQLAFPTTAFYDSKGELAYVKQGGYLHEEDFVADLKRYAH